MAPESQPLAVTPGSLALVPAALHPHGHLLTLPVTPRLPGFLFGNRLLKKCCSTKYIFLHIISKLVGSLPNQTITEALFHFFQSYKYTELSISSHGTLDLKKTLGIIQDLNDCLLGKSLLSFGKGTW